MFIPSRNLILLVIFMSSCSNLCHLCTIYKSNFVIQHVCSLHVWSLHFGFWLTTILWNCYWIIVMSSWERILGYRHKSSAFILRRTIRAKQILVQIRANQILVQTEKTDGLVRLWLKFSWVQFNFWQFFRCGKFQFKTEPNWSPTEKRKKWKEIKKKLKANVYVLYELLFIFLVYL